MSEIEKNKGMPIEELRKQIEEAAYALKRAKALLEFTGDYFGRCEGDISNLAAILVSRYDSYSAVNELIDVIVGEEAERLMDLHIRLGKGEKIINLPKE